MKGSDIIGTFCDKCRQVMCRCEKNMEIDNEFKQLIKNRRMKTTENESEKTFDQRAEEYFSALSKPYATEKGLVETAYVIGCSDQKRIEEFKNKPDWFVPPDNGDIKWIKGSENFTREEVFYLLWSQRAMINNDLRMNCGKEMTKDMYSILDNPRIPKY